MMWWIMLVLPSLVCGRVWTVEELRALERIIPALTDANIETAATSGQERLGNVDSETAQIFLERRLDFILNEEAEDLRCVALFVQNLPTHSTQLDPTFAEEHECDKRLTIRRLVYERSVEEFIQEFFHEYHKWEAAADPSDGWVPLRD